MDPKVVLGVLGHCRRHPSTFFCPQVPPQAGFGVAKKRCARRPARLVGQIWLENGKFFSRWVLPDPGCPGGPMVGSHSDCVVSWDSTEGLPSPFCPQGPPQAGFGVAKNRCARQHPSVCLPPGTPARGFWGRQKPLHAPARAFGRANLAGKH